MKSRILIPSLLFLFITTGLSLYHLFYLNGFGNEKYNLDLSEFKSIDRELNEEIFRYRVTLGSSNEELERAFESFKNQKDIILSVLNDSKVDPSLKIKFEEYFNKKRNIKFDIQKSVINLKNNIDLLNPKVSEFGKLNIKFQIEGKDFYKELVINTHRFVLSSDEESTNKFLEDKKILQQINAYSKTENPNLSELQDVHNRIYELNNIINDQFKNMRASSMEKEINEISQFIYQGIDENRRMKKNFLIMTIVVSLMYTLAILFFKNA